MSHSHEHASPAAGHTPGHAAAHTPGHAVHHAHDSAAKPHAEHDALLFEVYPEEDVTEHDIEKAILESKLFGVEWIKDFKKEEVGYGIWKLTAGAVISDPSVNTESIIEHISGLSASEAHGRGAHVTHLKKLVKSVKFAAYNRVS